MTGGWLREVVVAVRVGKEEEKEEYKRKMKDEERKKNSEGKRDEGTQDQQRKG